MSARYVRDIAYGAVYTVVAWGMLACCFLAWGPEYLPVVMSPDAPRVSSVVGARYDNFRPGAGLDPSQVIRDPSMDAPA